MLRHLLKARANSLVPPGFAPLRWLLTWDEKCPHRSAGEFCLSIASRPLRLDLHRPILTQCIVTKNADPSRLSPLVMTNESGGAVNTGGGECKCRSLAAVAARDDKRIQWCGEHGRGRMQMQIPRGCGRS